MAVRHQWRLALIGMVVAWGAAVVRAHQDSKPLHDVLAQQLSGLRVAVEEQGRGDDYTSELLRYYIGRSAGGAWRPSGTNAMPEYHGHLFVNLHRRALTMVRMLSKLGVSCPFDPTLSLDFLADGPRTIFVANLHNNEDLMPHFILNLLRFVALFPPQNIYVSIYESGSTDSTQQWLVLLRQLLDALQVPNLILSGTETRGEDEERVFFLAKMRNLAMQPLWERKWPDNAAPQRVVLSNDVYFCADDLMRLILHNAHVACAMDFSDEWFQAYDLWVARDRSGKMLSWFLPYVSDTYAKDRAKVGLPFPVGCCWNGAVAFDSEPFLRGGMRFRSAFEDECKASECSLFCNDLVRMGYDKIVVDPNVQLAYKQGQANELLSIKRKMIDGDLHYSPISKVRFVPALRAFADQIDWSRAGPVTDTLCCPSDKEFWKDIDGLCYMDNLMARNYTQMWMAGQGGGKDGGEAASGGEAANNGDGALGFDQGVGF